MRLALVVSGLLTENLPNLFYELGAEFFLEFLTLLMRKLEISVIKIQLGLHFVALKESALIR